MDTLETFFREIIEPWKRIRRWQGRVDADYENDLMHSWKTAMQALVFLALEREKTPRNDELEILTLALIHDISEACIGGDIAFPIKHDPRVQGIIDKIELEEFDKRFSRLPEAAADFLKNVNHIQGNMESEAGRLFAAMEMYGYVSFALAEVSQKKTETNAFQFREVLANSHARSKEPCAEFVSFNKLYGPFISAIESGSAANAWNLEIPLRDIIKAWESSRAWPEFLSTETVLDRTMKTALLAAVLIPIELKNREKKGLEPFSGLNVLVWSLVSNIAKSKVGVLPYRLKAHPSFPHEGVRAIEQEYFQKIMADFPEPARELMTACFWLEHDGGSVGGRFAKVIKMFSYLLFALYEYRQGRPEYAEVLKNCYSFLKAQRDEFSSFRMFFEPVRHEVANIVAGKTKMWIEVK